MKPIEEAQVAPSPGLTDRVRDFWTRNVNAERIMGRTVSTHERGDERYFADLEAQRYRSHTHLAPWIDSMQPGRSVLEIGCGIGLDSFRMARRGLAVTAVDLTEVGVETARSRFQRCGLAGEFRVADAENLPFEADRFDHVYSFGVLHHAADTARTIDEVHRVLKPGGEALVMLYNRHSLNEFMHRLTRIPFEERDELCPVVRRFTVSEVRALFRRYASVSVERAYAFGEGYGPALRYTPRFLYDFLSRTVGWHLMIRARK